MRIFRIFTEIVKETRFYAYGEACDFLTQSDYDILVRAIEIMAGATLRDQTAL